MNTDTLYRKYSVAVFTYMMIVIGFRFIGGKFLTDFYGLPLRDIGESYAYWLSLLMYYPHYIIHHYWACLLIDILVVVLPVLFLLFEKQRQWIAAVFMVFFWLQTATVDIFSLSHSKTIVCLYLAMLPILFRRAQFLLLVDFARYSTAFILLSASYFKFVHGAVLQKGNYSIALVNQYYDRMIMNPDHYLVQIATFVIDRPWLGDLLYRMLFISQVIFVVTFFTRRFDKLLILPLFAFTSLTYVFMGIYNMDLFIMSIPFYFSIAVKTALDSKI